MLTRMQVNKRANRQPWGASKGSLGASVRGLAVLRTDALSTFGGACTMPVDGLPSLGCDSEHGVADMTTEGRFEKRMTMGSSEGGEGYVYIGTGNRNDKVNS